MNKQTVVIVALSIDTKYATLYRQDGSTLLIKQGDMRLPKIVETSKDPLSRNEPVEVDITEIFAKHEEYAQAEKGTGGLVKFFRVAKKFVQELINTESPTAVAKEAEHITPVTLGLVPGTPVAEPVVEQSGLSKIYITDYSGGFNKVATIKAIRTCLNLGLKEAKDVAEQNLPYLLAENLTEDQRSLCISSLTQAPGLSFVTLAQEETFSTAIHSSPGVSFVSLAPEEEPEEKKKNPAFVPPMTPANQAPATPTNAEKTAQAAAKLDALMGNGAVDTDHPEFHKPLNEEQETIVAVNTVTGAVIPDAQKLAPHLKAASKLQDYTGFQKFFERLSAIVSQRGHSVEDLMKFMHQGDLPIADDGSIVAYKRLIHGKDGIMVDCHTGNVKQKVGSFVFMRHGLVDPNRRQDCSNGLHIAALSYLRNFSGNATVVVKINPEDVFAVPQYSHNKMRVAGYHIVAMLPEELRKLVNYGGSISSVPSGANLLNNILRGNHIGITQHVEIGGHGGSHMKYTDVAGDDNARKAFEKTEVKNTTVEIGAETSAEVEQPKAEPVVATDLKQPESEEMTQKDHVRKQFALLSISDKETAHKIAVDLMALKTRTGKTWFSLGLTDEQARAVPGYVMTAEQTQKAPVAETEPDLKAKAAGKAKVTKVKPASSGSSPRTRIRDLISNGIAFNVTEIIETKKRAKKGWAALGVTPQEQAEIEKHAK